jgi:hypothetical protein
MAEELTDHLGYEQGDPAGRGSGRSAIHGSVTAHDLDCSSEPGLT